MGKSIPVNAAKPVCSMPSRNLTTRKLSHFQQLTQLDEQFLDNLALPSEWFPAHANIIAEGGSAQSGFLIKEGTAIRHRDLPNGSRQILTFLIPGDLSDAHVFLDKSMDHSVSAITPVCIAPVSRQVMTEIFSQRDRIRAAMWGSWLQEQAMLRERIVSLGRRNARGRVAYLLCELLWRYTAVGLTDGPCFRLPLTQLEIGDALGLTPVRINFVLKEFRADSLILIQGRFIHLLDVAELQRISGLSADYLDFAGGNVEAGPHPRA